MQKSFISALFLMLFIACNSVDESNELTISRFKSKVNSNINKDGFEILEDMRAIIASGLIKFEIYDVEGKLIKVLTTVEDISPAFETEFNPMEMNIKSIENKKGLICPFIQNLGN